MTRTDKGERRSRLFPSRFMISVALVHSVARFLFLFLERKKNGSLLFRPRNPRSVNESDPASFQRRLTHMSYARRFALYSIDDLSRLLFSLHNLFRNDPKNRRGFLF